MTPTFSITFVAAVLLATICFAAAENTKLLRGPTTRNTAPEDQENERSLQFIDPFDPLGELPSVPVTPPSPMGAPAPLPAPTPCLTDGKTCKWDVFDSATDCGNCCSAADQVFDKWTCGSCLPDGDVCGEGTTCNQCCSGSHSYWYGKVFTACGEEACLESGSYCLKGTSCNNCCSHGSHWVWNKFSYYCN